MVCFEISLDRGAMALTNSLKLSLELSETSFNRSLSLSGLRTYHREVYLHHKLRFAMPKRPREEDVDDQRSSKQPRLGDPDRLSLLSDELLLRTLSFLSVSDLVSCQRCAHRTFTRGLVANRKDSRGGSKLLLEILSYGSLFSTIDS